MGFERVIQIKIEMLTYDAIIICYSHIVLNVDRGMTWEQALVRLKNHEGGKHNSFYCSRRAVRHQKLYILATQKDASSHLYKMARWHFLNCVFNVLGD